MGVQVDERPHDPLQAFFFPFVNGANLTFTAARCSQQVNATQEELNVITVTLFSPLFGKTEVESRVNVSRGRFNTLECVATVAGEQAYTLFSISGESCAWTPPSSLLRHVCACTHHA